MNVLVTGGRGYVGQLLGSYLKNLGHIVTLTSSTPQEGYLDLDVTSPRTFEKISDEYDLIVHAASLNYNKPQNYPERALLVNSLGTRNLLNHIAKFKKLKQFVYLSTFHVYGKSSGYINESTLVTPKSDYALTHYFAEKYIEAFLPKEINKLILRLSNAYACPPDVGMACWELLLNDICKQSFETGKVVISGNMEAERDFFWLGDLFRIIEKAYQEKLEGVFNVSFGHSLRIFEVVKILEEEYFRRLGKNLEVNCTRANSKIETDDRLVYSNKKIIDALGVEFTNMMSCEIQRIWDILENH